MVWDSSKKSFHSHAAERQLEAKSILVIGEAKAFSISVFSKVACRDVFATDEFSVDTGEESVGDSELPDFDGEIENNDELHIPCPNGHVLAVTRDLLQEVAICPYCGVEFELLERNSVEAKQKRAEQAERRAEKGERVFLYWGIGVAVIVVGTIIGLAIAYSK